jgi:methyltransferase-like protein
MVASRFGPEIEQTLRAISPDLLHMEQYMDFLRNRMFRQTLLCHTNLTPNHALKPDAVTAFHIASPAKCASENPDLTSDAAEQFRAEQALTLTPRDPLMKAAMLHLGEQLPVSVSFPDLLSAARQRLGSAAPAPSDDDARQLATRLLNCYTSNLVEFSLSPAQCVRDVSERPVASPYARLRARAGAKTTNLRLESIPLTPASRLVLQHLDGQHDRAALAALILDVIRSHPSATPADAPASAEEPSESRAAKYVDELLPAFARHALLVG